MLRLFDRWVAVTFWAFVLVASTIAFLSPAHGFTIIQVPPPPAEDDEAVEEEPPPQLPAIRDC